MDARCALTLVTHLPGSRRLAVFIAASALAAACGSGGGGDDSAAVDVTVVAIDRTGVTGNATWPADVATQVTAVIEQALDDDVESVQLIGIGSSRGDTRRLAAIDLTAVDDGNTRSKRETARRQVIAAAGTAASRFAGEPVTTSGTDVVAALTEAATLCHGPTVAGCSIVVVSDLEDQRVTGAPSAEAAVATLTPLMPSLEHIPVAVSGLGASGADTALVTKVSTAWEDLLLAAGATDVRIARSL